MSGPNEWPHRLEHSPRLCETWLSVPPGSNFSQLNCTGVERKYTLLRKKFPYLLINSLHSNQTRFYTTMLVNSVCCPELSTVFGTFTIKYPTCSTRSPKNFTSYLMQGLRDKHSSFPVVRFNKGCASAFSSLIGCNNGRKYFSK